MDVADGPFAIAGLSRLAQRGDGGRHRLISAPEPGLTMRQRTPGRLHTGVGLSRWIGSRRRPKSRLSSSTSSSANAAL